MKPLDLLAAADLLLQASPGRPNEVCLRRAVSSAYYALFHCLAGACADLLIGGTSAARSDQAWRQAYRALEHKFASDRCKDQSIMRKFPKEIEDFANAFVTLQEKRHQADYDPMANFYKSEVVNDILLVRQAIKNFKATKTKDRRAFCAHVLLKKRI